MSFLETNAAFANLNYELDQRRQAGALMMVNIHGKPDFKVHSFTPPVLEKYGIFRNRAPRLTGTLALRGFMTKQLDAEHALVIMGVETDSEAFGFTVIPKDEQWQAVLTTVAADLGFGVTQLQGYEG